MAKDKKIIIIVSLILFLGAISIVVPSLARLINNNDDSYWSGEVATSFHSGSGLEDDPYIISNEAEFAYFISLSKDSDFNGIYISLDNDIKINNGIFDDNTYILDNNIYYINDNKYYKDLEYTEYVGNLNILDSINNFNGYFNGNNHTISGLYYNNYFINNFSGVLSNTYFNNIVINGDSSYFINNSIDSKLSNIVFYGNLVSSSNSSFIYNSQNSDIYNMVLRGSITGLDIASYIYSSNNNKLVNSYSYMYLNGNNTGGLLYSSNNDNIVNCYYNSVINSSNYGSIIYNINNSILDNVLSNDSNYIYDGEYLDTKLYLFNEELDYNSLGYNEDNFIIDSIPYLNIDDYKNPDISISYLDNIYNDNHDIKKLDIKSFNDIKLNYNDFNSGIRKVSYYIDKSGNLDILDYNNIEWNIYLNNIDLNNQKQVIYLKVEDNYGNISYAYSDLFNLNGFNLECLSNNEILNSGDILSNKVITYVYSNPMEDSYLLDSSNLYISSNNKLPSDINISFNVDNENYVISNIKLSKVLDNRYYYSLEDGINIKDNNIKYKSSNFKKLIVNIDFSKSNIDNYNYNLDLVSLYNDKIYLDTLNYNKYNFNIINSKNNILLSSNYKDNVLLDNIGEVSIPVSYNKKEDNSYFIIKVLDSNKNKVNNSINNNINFIVNDKKYYFREDGIAYIYEDDLSNLKLNIMNNYYNLNNGTYYLVIDMVNSSNKNIISNDIVIPMTISNYNYNDIVFIGNMDSNDKYLIKKNGLTENNNKEISYNILYEGNLDDCSIKLSLLRKKDLSAYNQEYEEVDLNEYFNILYDKYNDSIWYNIIDDIDNGTYNINLSPKYNNLKYGTYKLVFGLYYKDNLIKKIEENIVVK